MTKSGDAYTWGSGAFGMLGHGEDRAEEEPRKVEFFEEKGLKVVSAGAGGYISWTGAFT